MKKLLIAVMGILLLMASSTNVYANSLSSASEWAKPEINAAAEQGFDGEIFASDYQKNATRAEFAEYALDIFGKLSSQSCIMTMVEAGRDKQFVDTNADYIMRAYQYGIIDGVSANKFNPNGNLTREQLCAILYRIKKKDVSDTVYSENIAPYKQTDFSANYDDIKDISPWALEAVQFMNANGIIKGNGTSLKPKATVTRQEAILMGYRFYQLLLSRSDFTLNADITTIEMCLNDFGYVNLDEIKFSEIGDFDNDGEQEVIVIVKDSGQGANAGDKIIYAELKNNGTDYFLQDSVDCTTKAVVATLFVKLNSAPNEMLEIISEQGGFALYNLANATIEEALDTTFYYSDMGDSQLVDSNNDGIYDGIADEFYGPSVFNFAMQLYFTFEDGTLIPSFKGGKVMLGDYPKTPAKVVEQYLYLNHLRVMTSFSGGEESFFDLPELDKRLKELHQGGYSPACVYDQRLLENTVRSMETDVLTFSTKQYGNKADVSLSFKGDEKAFYSDAPRDSFADFSLVRQNGKWTINSIQH